MVPIHKIINIPIPQRKKLGLKPSRENNISYCNMSTASETCNRITWNPKYFRSPILRSLLSNWLPSMPVAFLGGWCHALGITYILKSPWQIMVYLHRSMQWAFRAFLRDSSSDIQCLASAALWNFGANLPDALSVASFMSMKLAYPQSFQELLPVRNIKCLLGSKLSPTVCWPYRNTSLGSRLQGTGNPFSWLLNPGSLLSSKSALLQAEAFYRGRRAMQSIPCALGAEQGISLLIIRASSSIPTLPAAVALL